MNHTPVSIRAMFLRQIQIRGFKSFADKTVLEFVPGVSVIVGPNGSGKSNLVDAISWALGEQGPRALRGGQMADVIFAGTPSRPALGMAEVKLVIDNAAGKIPVPMSEIEIARTIFRSGDSEYRIGGQVVRLMDVQELLSESGIGRALHTVVGQGQLEEVLLSRPEDRRKYIEEAAGIAKHRRRKERAERKLGGLDQDLLRLSDVLAELRVGHLEVLAQLARVELLAAPCCVDQDARERDEAREALGADRRLAAARGIVVLGGGLARHARARGAGAGRRLLLGLGDGSGIAVADVDGDGLYDIYFVTQLAVGGSKAKGPKSVTQSWGEPFRWHKLFGHSFRFLKSVLASSSRVRGLGKGAMSPPFPRIAVDSLTCSLLVLNDRCLQ